MSECEILEENCETRVRDKKAMGDVLAKEHTENGSRLENTHSEDSVNPECIRQEAVGASEFLANKPLPIDTPLPDSLEVRFSLFYRFRSVLEILTLSQFSYFHGSFFSLVLYSL